MQRKEKSHKSNKLANLGAFSVLPNELISEITSQLDYIQITYLSLASKEMYSIVDQSFTRYEIQGKKSTYAAVRQVLNRRYHVQREIEGLEKDPRYLLYKFYTRFQCSLDLMFSLSLGVLLAPPTLSSSSENTSLQLEAKHVIKSFALIGVMGAGLLFSGGDFSRISALHRELKETPNPISPALPLNM